MITVLFVVISFSLLCIFMRTELKKKLPPNKGWFARFDLIAFLAKILVVTFSLYWLYDLYKSLMGDYSSLSVFEQHLSVNMLFMTFFVIISTMVSLARYFYSVRYSKEEEIVLRVAKSFRAYCIVVSVFILMGYITWFLDGYLDRYLNKIDAEIQYNARISHTKNKKFTQKLYHPSRPD